MSPTRFEHGVSSDHIRLNECAWPIDRTVNMRFGRQMHYRQGTMSFEDTLNCCGIANIDFLKRIPGIGAHVIKRAEISRIGQTVDINDGMLRFRNQMTDHGRADKASSTRDEDFHNSFS